VLPFAESFGIYPSRKPATSGSLAAVDLIGTHLLADDRGVPQTYEDATGTIFDGGVAANPHPIQTSLVKAFLKSAGGIFKPSVKPFGPKPAKARPKHIRGALKNLLEARQQDGFKDISEIPDQVLATAYDPKKGFDNFSFKTSDNTTNYVF